MSPRPALVLLVFLCLLAPAAAAQEPTPEQEVLMEEIRALRKRLDELLAQLPPHLRERLDEVPPAEPPAAEPPAAVEPPSVEPPSVEPPAAEPPPPPRRRRRSSCNTLLAFDENDDGRVDASDRYWRYLYLWNDRNGNGEMEEREILNPFDEKVRHISVDLETFEKTKGIGEIRLGEAVTLDLKGDGFGGGDDAVLAVDATSLGRRGGPQLLDAEGRVLEGIVAFRPGLALRDADGSLVELDCP